MTDFLRPRLEPARTIYDAFQEEAKKRNGRDADTWQEEERSAVLAAASKYAHENGLDLPTMGVIEAAENSAMGHSDYGSKWAIGVSHAMKAHLDSRSL